ncbi:MaoC/PaaZ C-terminal domain-containing protein [Gryllotalpicola sp.]|uniref:MaoC/PaaZ C-terminal domain-containing protein n=1 Tax=Gryllotalpicola sp. TaxID=1932787 RepID=UPI00262AB0E9|nr:MaoC/PaaZ C-terminal domain-containing protein [Gryllotalpicola sp.]
MSDDAAVVGRRIAFPEHYWDDLQVGDVLASTGITITEAHLVSWAGLTGDIVEFHINKDFAAGTPFGERIGHGPLTLSVALGLTTQTGYFSKVVAWLGLDAVRASKPVLIGDTIRAEATVRETRPTRKAGNGVWSLDYQVLNQRDETVMTFTSGFLVAMRPE